MKWIPIIDNPFPSNMHVENHHLLNDFYSKEKNCWFVIPLPTVTHNYVGGKTRNKLHWVHNARWIKKIYGIDVKDFLLGI